MDQKERMSPWPVCRVRSHFGIQVAAHQLVTTGIGANWMIVAASSDDASHRRVVHVHKDGHGYGAADLFGFLDVKAAHGLWAALLRPWLLLAVVDV
jgi:hypothetical protein